MKILAGEGARARERARTRDRERQGSDGRHGDVRVIIIIIAKASF